MDLKGLVDQIIRATERKLEAYLAPFLRELANKKQRHWAPLYVRGLLLEGDRKSVERLAERVSPGDHQQLHNFIASEAWHDAGLEKVLLDQADKLVGGTTAKLIIDDTSLPKKGEHSVGVARQYCGALGKQANCQSLVSVTLAGKGMRMPIALRLYLPKSWATDDERRRTAGVPESVLYRPKWRIALEEIERVRRAGVVFGCVLGDAGYGAVAEFRHELSLMQLTWAVGVKPNFTAFPSDVELLMPTASKGAPRKHPVPSAPAMSLKKMIALLGEDAFKRISWRTGTKGKLAAQFAAKRIRMADGPSTSANRRLPGEEVWLVCERRSNGETKYHLTNHATDAPLKTIIADLMERWPCELAHQQLKEELGLDHFEGRSWTGLHHHAVLTMIAFGFLEHQRVTEKHPAAQRD